MKSTVRALAVAIITLAAATPLSAQRHPAVHGDILSPFPILSDPLTVTRTQPDFRDVADWYAGHSHSSDIVTGSVAPGMAYFLFSGSPLEESGNHVAGVSAMERSESIRLACAPNPFAGSTTIHFAIADPQDVTITIMDEAGREVARPLDGVRHDAGDHMVRFDAAELPSGRYFCAVTVNHITEVRKLIVVR